MIVCLARYAMATRFEFVLQGEDEQFLRAVGEEALDEVERIESQLSFFQSDSDLTDINRNAARGLVQVDPRVFRLFRRAKELSSLTEGAFDITVAPLLRLWGLRGGRRNELPAPAEIEAVRALVGMQNVELDEVNFTVRFLREGVTLDLGAIGKGYAIERAAEIVRERGISCALLHGGTSTVCAVGAPLNEDTWKIAIRNPVHTDSADRSQPPPHLAIAYLSDMSLSVSAQHSRSVVINGKSYGHTIDPRTGYPVEGALLSGVICDSATDADAMSTALLILGKNGAERIGLARSSIAAFESGRDIDIEVSGNDFAVT